MLEEQAHRQWLDDPTTIVFLKLLKQERERLIKDIEYVAVKRGVSDSEVRIIAAQLKTTDDIIETINDRNRYKGS